MEASGTFERPSSFNSDWNADVSQQIPLLDLKAQYASIRDELDDAVRRVVEAQGFVMGPEVEAFEEEIAGMWACGMRWGWLRARTRCSCRCAPSMRSPASHVIVPSFTFFATAGAVWNAGLRPVFCDVDPDTFNVTAETVEAVWTERTVAVIPVHLVRADRADDGGHGAGDGAGRVRARGRGAGDRGIGTGGRGGRGGRRRGVQLLPDEEPRGVRGWRAGDDERPVMAERVAKLRVHGGRQMYHHELVGTNSRLDALQAAVLRVKLRYRRRVGGGAGAERRVVSGGTGGRGGGVGAGASGAEELITSTTSSRSGRDGATSCGGT
jgi:hypothetical protein